MSYYTPRDWRMMNRGAKNDKVRDNDNDMMIAGAHKRRTIRPMWRRECSHSGVRFPEPYVPIAGGIGIRHSPTGEIVQMPADVEEFALMFSRLAPETRDARFRSNFFEDWRGMFLRRSLSRSPSRLLKISTVDDWDWGGVLANVNSAPVEKIQVKDKNKDKDKATALVDGVRIPTTRVMVDRPGIFLGRGKSHPLNGRIRRRLYCTDVDINISSGAAPPAIPPNATPDTTSRATGSAWRSVIHDPYVSWLARWTDPLTGDKKYVYLDPGWGPKSRHDRLKFDVARRLQSRLDVMRAIISRDTSMALSVNDDMHRTRLLACVGLVDVFSIRVGGDEEDGIGGDSGDIGGDQEETIGASTLRRKHVCLISAAASSSSAIRLRFVGKDKILHDITRVVSPVLARAVAQCMHHARRKEDPLFPGVHATDANAYLHAILPDVTCKTLRTRTASELVDRRLRSVAPSNVSVVKTPASSASASVPIIRHMKKYVELACMECAWHLNHKRNSPSYDGRRNVVTDACDDDVSSRGQGDVRFSRFLRLAAEAWQRVSSDHQPTYTYIRPKSGGTGRLVAGSSSSYGPTDGPAELKEALVEAKMLGLAPNTSKLNYVDPRILVAFCKRHDLPIQGVAYTASQTERFRWAASTPGTFKFVYKEGVQGSI